MMGRWLRRNVAHAATVALESNRRVAAYAAELDASVSPARRVIGGVDPLCPHARGFQGRLAHAPPLLAAELEAEYAGTHPQTCRHCTMYARRQRTVRRRRLALSLLGVHPPPGGNR
jgi:hypothetical protein